MITHTGSCLAIKKAIKNPQISYKKLLKPAGAVLIRALMLMLNWLGEQLQTSMNLSLQVTKIYCLVDRKYARGTNVVTHTS
jgi:hypothetical protein